jgi:hypothetical protein
LLESLKGFNVHEVCAGKTMLCDQDRLTVALELIEEFCRLSLQSRDKFGSHEVILKCHCSPDKVLVKHARVPLGSPGPGQQVPYGYLDQLC